MQISKNKTNILILATVAISLFAVASRALIMTYSFDFTSLFFENNTVATLLYAFVLISMAIIFFASKKVAVSKIRYGAAYKILELLTMLIFILILISKMINKTSHIGISKTVNVISIVSLIASVIYYFMSVFVNTSATKGFIKIINIFPTVYLTAELIEAFVSVSSKANSYYLFPHIVSILCIAFLITNDAKQKALTFGESPVTLCSYAFIAFISLCFSSLPDLFLIFKLPDALQGSGGVLFVILKIIYIIYSAYIVLTTVKSFNEVK